MIWHNINFWRVASFGLFAMVLFFVFLEMGVKPKFTIEASSMEIVESPEYGALFKFTIRNDGRAGDAYVNCYLYLYERGGDKQSDYIVLGIDSGQSKSGELFIPLRPGQTVHDWRVEIHNYD
ncbi:MAG: hypothetical protein IBX61_09125 [Thermoleophilia bacterium]|nr:hypothetical protein [Thermoleophilia bacterium]